MNTANWHSCFSSLDSPNVLEKISHIPIRLLACLLLNSGISVSDEEDTWAAPYPHASPVPQMQLRAELPPPALLTNATHHDGNLLVPAKRGLIFVIHALGFPPYHFTKAEPKDCPVTGQSFSCSKVIRSCF